MEKRYQVFVSSTFEDLKEERQQVIQALLELDCIPAGMELFPAADEDQWTLIKKIIDDCDYYLLIMGGRYGSISPSGKSYTQVEYEYALSIGKPIISFLHEDPKQLPASKVETSEEGIKGLNAFRQLAKNKMCKFWTTPEGLGGVVSRAVVQLRKSRPAVGWVRADAVFDAESTTQFLQMKRRIDELEKELDSVRTTKPAGTELLASGEDTIEFGYSVTHYADSNYRSDEQWDEYRMSTTWNYVLTDLLPLMLHGTAYRDDIDSRINNLVKNWHFKNVWQEELKDRYLAYFKMDSRDIDTILMQGRALGLFVMDEQGGWSLTPYGDHALSFSRAIKKNDAYANISLKED